MRKLFLGVLPFLIIFLLPQHALAYTEITGYFIEDGVSTLARGGLERLPQSQEKLDFDSPLFLDSHGKYRLDTTYENQRTVRIFNGSWAGSHAYAGRQESAVASPFSLWNGSVVASVAAGYGFRSFDVNAESVKEDVFVSSRETFTTRKGGVFLKALDKVSLGMSVVDTDYRGRLEIPVELEIAPLEMIKVGYKRSYLDFAGDYAVRLSGNSGTVPVRFGEGQNELYVKGVYKGILTAQYANELKNRDNRRFNARLELPGSLYLNGIYARRGFNFNQEFLVDESPGGYLKGDVAWREYRIGAGADVGHWNIEANYRRQKIESSGGGIASSAAIVSFWPSLIVGNYNHLYSVAMQSDQYHLGAEYQGKNFSMGFGAQYLDLRPVASFDYWRSLLFGLGRTGAGNFTLRTDRIQLLFLSLGLGYRWEHASLQYAFGQFIPIATHDTKPASSQEPSGSDGGGGGSSDLFSGISDKVNYNPGGNIQRLILTLTF